jgi:biopolymer transport protein ExbD
MHADETDGTPITAINVTPLVDVMLVLLVVFIVTAQLKVSRAMAVDPPRAVHAGASTPAFVLTIDQADTMRLEDREVTPADLARAAAAAHARDPDARAVIRAADRATHGAVLRAMDALKAAGISRIAFAARP